jgi:hypothetical protein
MTARAIPIIVVVKNRPNYLWACLDSLYRQTITDHRVTLVDMASDDPAIATIITAFERRGLINEVVRLPTDDPGLLADLIFDRLSLLSPFFAYIEGDVVIADSDVCWLAKMAECMDADNNLAMLGSVIDKSDFVDIDVARKLHPDLVEPLLQSMIKGHSAERLQSVDDAEGRKVFRPHNPAGRLMLLRTSALQAVGAGSDGELDRKFREAGYSTGISTEVQHRHLSLLHVFDQPDYDYVSRAKYMKRLNMIEVKSEISGLQDL